ncbi:acyltransferase [Kineosporia sp. J2-2]|uniref:Acyltransferase n=1 Tax=Kineosporia corallincola TaxID=2835133 RepID=A0ABS5TEG5_9ACTN|nr:acyltransferase [Kineosporia corallincola]MBT0769470.1 acyltransferase [Kineosporia corallincola]
MKHNPALDGLRGIAILAVVLSHALATRGFSGGWIGVEIFFVLSGYLITSILMNEWDARGEVSLRRFYYRRVLRLYPALITLVMVGAVFGSVLGYGESYAGYLLTAILCVSYLMDFSLFFFADYFTDFGQLGHVWSLSVEEHFYLLWPVALLVLLRRRVDPRWATALATLVSVVLLATTGGRLIGVTPASYFAPHTQACAPLIGCLLALQMRRNRTSVLLVRRAAQVGFVGLLGLAGTFAYASAVPKAEGLVPQVILSVVFSALVIFGVSADRASAGAKALSLRPLRWIGKISYGWYLYHLPLEIVLQRFLPIPDGAAIIISVPVSLLAAALSYRYIEEPFLRRKPKTVAAGHPAPGTGRPVDRMIVLDGRPVDARQDKAGF